MKKTILTLTTMLALAVGSVHASYTSNLNERTNATTMLETSEISTFCKAVVKGDIETVRRLIELGEDVNQKSLGMRPTHFAARYNKVEILELLVANGADLSLRSDRGYTVEKYAELSNAKEALAYIKIAKKG